MTVKRAKSGEPAKQTRGDTSPRTRKKSAAGNPGGPTRSSKATPTKAPRAAQAGTGPAKRKKSPAHRSDLANLVVQALDDMKAVHPLVLDVRSLTDIADTLVIASGNSDRHVRSIADRVIEYVKKAGFRPAGVEGEHDGEWVLVDLHDVIVHIMLPRVREFYRLEDLWGASAAQRQAAQG